MPRLEITSGYALAHGFVLAIACRFLVFIVIIVTVNTQLMLGLKVRNSIYDLSNDDGRLCPTISRVWDTVTVMVMLVGLLFTLLKQFTKIHVKTVTRDTRSSFLSLLLCQCE